MKKRLPAQAGYTLIEMMVVVVLFAVIGIVASETLILTLRGTYKAAAISKVRQNLDYAMSSMERQLRGAKSITSVCNNGSSNQITFIDQNNNPVTFACVGINPTYIASSSSNLTSSDISISTCNFVCSPGNANSPASVTIHMIAQDQSGQNTPVDETTQVTLRNF